jgi:hypothetical protein
MFSGDIFEETSLMMLRLDKSKTRNQRDCLALRFKKTTPNGRKKWHRILASNYGNTPMKISIKTQNKDLDEQNYFAESWHLLLSRL